MAAVRKKYPGKDLKFFWQRVNKVCIFVAPSFAAAQKMQLKDGFEKGAKAKFFEYLKQHIQAKTN